MAIKGTFFYDAKKVNLSPKFHNLKQSLLLRERTGKFEKPQKMDNFLAGQYNYLSFLPVFHYDEAVFLSKLFQSDTNFRREITQKVNVSLEEANVRPMSISKLKNNNEIVDTGTFSMIEKFIIIILFDGIAYFQSPICTIYTVIKCSTTVLDTQ